MAAGGRATSELLTEASGWSASWFNPSTQRGQSAEQAQQPAAKPCWARQSHRPSAAKVGT